MDGAQQQVLDRIRQANNILVTVSTNPSVDQLAAAIGMTLLLNRMDKHATAVFSGKVPSTLEFLQPEKTIEANTDSLRDFIISLDKEKADKLRYKVEDQVVRIFITPYKTSLSEKDLIFSQGDFNVEVVIALGIVDRMHIDAAITAHGRILHDATVICLNTGQAAASDLGQINWQDKTASSLSEMVATLAEEFGTDLIDNQMATAFLTGIVAETNRFSNPKTSPKAMTISAHLMAAGANQQLIVSKLEPTAAPRKYEAAAPAKPAGQPEATPDDGELRIDHAKSEPSTSHSSDSAEIHIDAKGNIVTAAGQLQPEPEPDAAPEPLAAAIAPPITVEASTQPAPQPAEPSPAASQSVNPQHELLNPAEQTPILGSDFSAAAKPDWEDPYNSVSFDPLSPAGSGAGLMEHHGTEASEADSASLAEQARKAADAAHAAAPFDPAFEPPVQALGAQGLPTAAATSAKTEDKPAAPPFPPPIENVARKAPAAPAK